MQHSADTLRWGKTGEEEGDEVVEIVEASREAKDRSQVEEDGEEEEEGGKTV